MPKRIQFRRDTAANWALHNPRLLTGEIGLETDTQKFKIGDGILDWEDLPYYLSLAAQVDALDEAVDQAVLDATTLAEGYKDAAAGSASAADADATAAAASAAVASAAADAAEAVGDSNDAIVSALVEDDDSDTNDAVVALINEVTGGNVFDTMNTAARDALPSPATGFTIYNTTTDRLELYDGINWVASVGGAEAGGTLHTFGSDIDTAGGNIELGNGGVILKNGEYDSPSTAERNNFSGSSVFDFVDGTGVGGGTPGYSTMKAECANYQELGPPIGSGAWWATDTGDGYGITINASGMYLFSAKMVMKRNGGSGFNCKVDLRRNAAASYTSGTSHFNVNLYFARVDNLFSEQIVSRVIEIPATSGDYFVWITAATSGANITSMGYGTGWQLTRLGDR